MKTKFYGRFIWARTQIYNAHRPFAEHYFQDAEAAREILKKAKYKTQHAKTL